MAGERKSIRNIDIAREAGVTNSVVSSYFSGNYYEKRKGAVVGIGKGTKEKINKACRKLGYRPPDSALFMEIYPEEADVFFLLNKDSGSYSYSFYSSVLDGLVDEAEQSQVNLSLGWFVSSIDYCVQKSKVPRIVKNNPTGKYVLAGKPNYSLILYLLQSGAKVVYTSRFVEVPGVFSVVPDYCEAAKLAISYLEKCGHHRIEMVADAHFHANGYNTLELLKGCKEAFASRGREIAFEDILPCAYNERQRTRLKRALKGKNAPTAIFCFDDSSVMALMRDLVKWGIRVPDDLSIISFNDVNQNLVLSPPITGVGLRIDQIGKVAFQRITQLAKNGRPLEAGLEILPVELVERESVRPAGNK